MRAAARALALLAGLAPAAAAHDGPPYPIVEDAVFAGGTMTVYADPDVGTGTFYLYLDQPLDERALTLGAWPADGRLPEATVTSLPAAGAPYQRYAEIEFDERGPWKLRIADPAAAQDLVVDIDVTPPGSLGPFDLVWFLSPFAVVAFLWTKAILERRRHRLALGSAA